MRLAEAIYPLYKRSWQYNRSTSISHVGIEQTLSRCLSTATFATAIRQLVLLNHAFVSRKAIVFAAQEHIPGLTFHCEKPEFMQSVQTRNTFDSTITRY